MRFKQPRDRRTDHRPTVEHVGEQHLLEVVPGGIVDFDGDAPDGMFPEELAPVRLLLRLVLGSLLDGKSFQVLLPQLRPSSLLLRPADLGSQVVRALLLRLGEIEVVDLPLFHEPEELQLPLVEERFRTTCSCHAPRTCPPCTP